MPTIQLLRWTAQNVLRHPAPWLGGGLLAAAWPAVRTFTELGITTSPDTEQLLVLQLVYLGLLLGVLWGRSMVGSARWMLERCVGLRRLSAESTLLAAPAAWFAGAALLAPLITGSLTMGSAVTILVAGVLATLHLVSVALVLESLGARDGLGWTRAWWVLPLLVWAAPSWLAGVAQPGPALAELLDPRLLLEPSAVHGFGLPAISALLPIVAWALTALLLAHPRATSSISPPVPARPAG